MTNSNYHIVKITRKQWYQDYNAFKEWLKARENGGALEVWFTAIDHYKPDNQEPTAVFADTSEFADQASITSQLTDYQIAGGGAGCDWEAELRFQEPETAKLFKLQFYNN